ncbi:MAG: hypothetical protein E7358_04965 [Clostridiales bacterium]|nr:hypothetical protein [Clostridiales bacterium]
MTAIKIIAIILIALIIFFPMFPFGAKIKKFSTIHALKYSEPNNKKNLYFVLLSTLFCVVVLLLLKILNSLSNAVLNVSFINDLFAKISEKIPSNVDFISTVAIVVIVNVIIIYGYSFLKLLLKVCILDPAYGLGKRPRRKKKKRCPTCGRKMKVEVTEDSESKENNENATEGEKKENDKEVEDKKRILVREREILKKSPRGKIRTALWSIFFEKPDFVYAKNWVIRTKNVLQGFIYLVEVLYALIFILLLWGVFFVAPDFVYFILVDILQFQDWYLYPFISLIILQEICNFFNTKIREVDEVEEQEEQKRQEKKEKIESDLRALHLEIQRRFDGEHNLRYYPEAGQDTAVPYQCTNRPYASALDFIQNRMKEKSGRIVHSYMECLDSSYNDKNVYFCASFYSEFGDYLIHYTYTRLLSGMRMVFILSDKSRVLALRKYISDALMSLIDASEDCTWRVYTSEERLDQADVLVATPEDFKNDEMVENYPSFFDEVSNAVFIDADTMIELESYLCPVIAKRLQKASNDRVRFIFLTKAIIRGFTASTLPRFFCLDDVLSFSSANENEAVSYTLWNKESKRNVVYNRHGQTLTNLETMIAEQAVNHGVDGVRVVTPCVLDRSERDVLDSHDIEINKFYKQPLPRINYMIYTDDRSNLSAALYTATRFRGTEKSLVHIISHPYLLREYFMDRIISEEYINRSSFIQPRVSEHVNKAKLSFLKLFCDATTDEGMSISEFENKMLSVMEISKQREDSPLCPYCSKPVELGEFLDVNVEILAAYLLAALYDDADTPVEESIARRVKDYYIIIDAADYDGYSLVKDKRIQFKHVKEILSKVYKCNERVKLCINDQIIGELETFPVRVPLEYVVGQSIVYNNIEYEIERISQDNKILFLRHENVTFKNCLDTIFMRRYAIEKDNGAVGIEGVFHKTEGMLEEIRVSMHNVDFRGETYGFYSLLSNCQTLDFVRGAVGNPHLDKVLVDDNARNIKNGKVLYVSLKTRMDCTDEMRLLLSAVFNEFIRTIFPKTYHCISICPVLENIMPYSANNEPNDYLGRVKSLYPYLTNLSIVKEEGDESYKREMKFLFINDCMEDVGVLDWFYDKFGHYMHEFLANVYSYLHWLKLRPELNHYIYFGADKLAECFDVEKCCELLGDYNIILSEVGVHDYETAGDNIVEENPERCSFCGNVLESGRYLKLDDGRFICVDCDKQSVRTADELLQAEKAVRAYLEKEYPDVMFGTSTVKFNDGLFNKEDMTASQINYRVDFDSREIYVEAETPRMAIECSILRGIIKMWQHDNELLISYADAQLEFEEIKYLKLKGYDAKIDLIKEKYDVNMLADVEQITESVEGEDATDNSSFAFMRKKYTEIINDSEIDNVISDDEPSELYDPMKTPRFWKRYLRGEKITDGEDLMSKDDRTEQDEPTEDDYSEEINPIEESSNDEVNQVEEPAEEESEVAVTEDETEVPVNQDEEI